MDQNQERESDRRRRPAVGGGRKPKAKRLSRSFKSFDGTKIAYRLWGDATKRTPLLCFSGVACDEMYWVDLATKLGSERLAVSWDYPYHGASSPAKDPLEITVPSLARHGHKLVEHLSLPPAVLAGHSMGVQVILEYYRLFPEEVSGLMMLAGPHQHTVGHLYGTGIGQYILTLLEVGARAQPALAQTAWRLATTPEVVDPLGRFAGLIGDDAPRKMMSRYFRHLGSLELVPLLEMFRAGQQHSAEDLLEKIDVPVLILHGTHDVMTPLTLAEEMARRIPDAELVAIDGGAHTLPIENPDLIYREVQRFLRSKVDRGN